MISANPTLTDSIPASASGPAPDGSIIGAGPAGRTAAQELQKLAPGARPMVLGVSTIVGGISRTEPNEGDRSGTETAWGSPANRIEADSQRINDLSLPEAAWNALSGSNDSASLIERSLHPRRGPGMMWERAGRPVEAHGGEVRLGAEVVAVHREGGLVTSVTVRPWREEGGEPDIVCVEGDQFVSIMALRDLVQAFDPPAPAPAPVREAAARLRHRDFIIVTLRLERPDLCPDHWICIYGAEVKVGRVQNFPACSPEMSPASSRTFGRNSLHRHDDQDHPMSSATLAARNIAGGRHDVRTVDTERSPHGVFERSEGG